MMDVSDASKVEYYHYYEGSLITPSFTESVTWYVSSVPLTATPDQIKK